MILPRPATGWSWRLTVALATLVFGLLALAACSGDGSGTGDDEALSGQDDPPEVDVGADPDGLGLDSRPRLREIRLGLTDWTGSRINLAIAELVIERRLGHPVTAVPAGDYRDMFQGLESGRLDAVLELWPESLTGDEWAYLESGRVENLGALGVEGRVGWYVPRYVIEADPTLDSWEGFKNPSVVADFATAATPDRGRFVGTDPSYEQFDTEIINALDLDFVVDYTGSEDATRRELAQATAAAEPILLYWWSPTAEIVEFDLVRVELPAQTEECLEAVDDGGLMSCDYPSQSLFKAVNPSLAESDPAVYRFLSAFTLSTEEQLTMIHRVEVKGQSINDVAADWVNRNGSTWEPWLD